MTKLERHAKGTLSTTVVDSSASWVQWRYLHLLIFSLLLGVFGLFGLLVAAPSAFAAAQTVTDCSSTSDASSNVGTTGTLAYALANYASGDTISFACSGGTGTAYTISVPSTVNLTKNLTLDGTGYQITLDGGGLVGILNVNSGVNFTLNNLTVANGYTGGQGGGIYNSGTLTVTNVTFANNYCYNSGGGAIYNYTGSKININSSIFTNNSSHGYGGAIYNGGTINSINNSTFANNTSTNFYGGAIYSSNTISSISNTTFNNNVAHLYGGAIYAAGLISNISNSTFANNTSVGGNGGAIYTYFGTISSINNSTLAGNNAGSGKAIYNYQGTVTFQNSILADTSGNNCYNSGTFNDGGYNLSDDGSCGFTATGSRNSVTKLNLNLLANNGGATQTILPGKSSAAIDVIPNGTNGCGTTITTDQRGVARPKGNGCDVGAVEVQFGPEYLGKTGGDGQSAQEQTLYTQPHRLW